MTNAFGGMAVPLSAVTDRPLAPQKILQIALCWVVQPRGSWAWSTLLLQGGQVFQVPASRIDVGEWVYAVFIWVLGSCPEWALLSPLFREVSVERGFVMHQSEGSFSWPLFCWFFIRVDETGLKSDLSIVKSTGDG